jgi:hypothetical protein
VKTESDSEKGRAEKIEEIMQGKAVSQFQHGAKRGT